VGEAIEVEGPAGTDLAGYSIVLYNLTGGAVYNTRTLSGTLPASCGERGVLAFNYPQDGIQNGPQDGFALVDNTGAVVEFLSYEGVLTATNGPAAGLTSVDIGASQSMSPPQTPLAQSTGLTHIWSVSHRVGQSSTGPPQSISVSFGSWISSGQVCSAASGVAASVVPASGSMSGAVW